MKIGRIAEAFPWRTVLIFTAALCLSTLASWAWFSWELPPLQRYYLRAYWDSSRIADDPQAVTKVRWLDLTAPGHQDGWPLDVDVDDDPFDSSQVALSYRAVARGWTGIKISPPDPARAAELQVFLQRSIYHGRDIRQFFIEPAFYACCAVFLALFVAWRIRDRIATEWMDLWRAAWKPESVKQSAWDIPPHRQPLRARIRNRIAGSLATLNGKRKPLLFARLAPHHSVPDSLVESPSKPTGGQASLSADDPELSMEPRNLNPGATMQTNKERNKHLVFPGSSPSYVPSKDADAWRESEWIG